MRGLNFAGLGSPIAKICENKTTKMVRNSKNKTVHNPNQNLQKISNREYV